MHQPLAVGRSTCRFCGYSGSHTVLWPEAAYYKTDVRGHVLWAWDMETAEALMQYLAVKHRNAKGYKGCFSFLLHVPTQFKKAKVRKEAVLKLRRLLLKAKAGQRPTDTEGEPHQDLDFRAELLQIQKASFSNAQPKSPATAVTVAVGKTQ